MKTKAIVLAGSLSAVFQIHAGSVDNWTTAAPREEIRPQFRRTETGGRSGHGALAIHADGRVPSIRAVHPGGRTPRS